MASQSGRSARGQDGSGRVKAMLRLQEQLLLQRSLLQKTSFVCLLNRALRSANKRSKKPLYASSHNNNIECILRSSTSILSSIIHVTRIILVSRQQSCVLEIESKHIGFHICHSEMVLCPFLPASPMALPKASCPEECSSPIKKDATELKTHA
jgi:hypothetical protein